MTDGTTPDRDADLGLFSKVVPFAGPGSSGTGTSKTKTLTTGSEVSVFGQLSECEEPPKGVENVDYILERDERTRIFNRGVQSADMSAYVTGRTLDENGVPITGTGFEVEDGGWLEDRIQDRTGPITSHPTRPVWGIPLTEGNGPIRTLSVFGPGYDGPPAHYHDQSVEQFDVEAGSVVMTLDGEDRTVSAGESATVHADVVHTFRNETDERALVTTEIRSPGRLRQVLPTLGGLAHDRSRDADDPLQQVRIADALDGNTTFVRGGGIADSVANVLAPIAALAGYQGAYATYMQPAFWEDHVEQPEQ